MINIISFNANGLRSTKRRQQAMTICSADIICLQETHWDVECMKEIEKEWLGEVFVNNGGVNCRGVVILVKRGLAVNVNKCDDDGEGRIIGITFEHMGRKVKLLNVYAPNEEKERGSFFQKLGRMCVDECIVVGDFNVWCGRLDVSMNMHYRNDSSRDVLKEVMKERKMFDVWRERNPEGRVFSRTQMVAGTLKQSRIDLILSTRGLVERIGTIQYNTNVLSDHKVLKFSIGSTIQRRGGGVWCLNSELLKDENYKKRVRECFRRRMDESMYDEDIGGWWESVKVEIKKISIGYSRHRKRFECEKERSLKKELDREAARADVGESDLKEYIRIKGELGEIEQRRCNGAIVRSRARYVVEGEKCTKYFLGLEKTKQERNYLERVVGRDGEIITDFVGIAERVQDFYTGLFRKEETDDRDIELVLDKVRARLSEGDKESCEGEIGSGEIEAAISGLGRNKSPGIDGITGEFYREFRQELVPVLVRVYRQIEETGELLDSMMIGIVSIIYKKGDRNRLENYRPLSMLNNDYKILARVLANRIKGVIGTVVGNTQAYSIPGRDIADTVSSIRDTIQHMKAQNTGIVLSLDLNKAFDRVDHKYLYRVLEAMGFGNRLIGWIKVMYDRAVSRVKVNGIITDRFRLERSVRQGCPLSALLYSLSAEPLAALLAQNGGIKGIELPDGNTSLIYQYADDTTVTVKDRESVGEVLRCVEQYGRASGAKVNLEKSEIMYVGGDRIERCEVELKERKDFIKVLGVNLGIADKEGRDVQYEGLVNSIKKTLSFWKMRGLKLKGKVIVVNGLVISKFVYVMNVLDVPVKVSKEVERMVSEFLWGGKGVRIAREILENDYKCGGLKLVNLEVKKRALRVKMMLRYLKNPKNHVWKIFLKEAIHRCGGCGESGVFIQMKRGMLGDVSEFHKEMLVAWGEFVCKIKYECKNVQQVWQQPIFMNPQIMHEGETMYNRIIWKVGIRTIRDVVYEYVPGFMRAQAIVDVVREREEEMWLGTAEGIMEKIKNGMPREWKSMIENESGPSVGGEVEMYVKEGEKRVCVLSMKTKTIYECLRGKEGKRPAGEKVWEKVMGESDMDVRKIWMNLRVKWNNVECENFDFLLRHNRVFNNLVISKFDVKVRKECDVCEVAVETCMHEFFECAGLRVYFEKIKELINRCWKGEWVKKMEWRELWLFGVNGKMDDCNVALLNYVLSHARYAVKLRRNLAHYERKTADVWGVFQCMMKRDVSTLYSYVSMGDFHRSFVVGSTFIIIGEDKKLIFDFG